MMLHQCIELRATMSKRNEDREEVYNVIYSFLHNRENATDVAAALEEGCWKYAAARCTGRDETLQLYSATCYRILYSMTEEIVSEFLWKGLFDGTVNALTVAEMRPNEYHPAANAKIYEEIERRREQKIEVAVCTLYKCPKCKQNRSSPLTFQSSAADEGSTTSTRCLTPTCNGFIFRPR